MTNNEPEISLNQLKIIAAKYGHNLHKKSEKSYLVRKLMRCPICDKKRTIIMQTPNRPVFYRVCKNCGFRRNSMSHKYGTNIGWNDTVKDCLKSKGQNLVDGGNDNVEY